MRVKYFLMAIIFLLFVLGENCLVAQIYYPDSSKAKVGVKFYDNLSIARGYAKMKKYEALYNLLLSYPDFNSVMEGKGNFSSLEYYKLFFLAVYQTKRWELAWNVLDILKSLEPQNASWIYFLGRVAYFTGVYSKALAYFSQIDSHSGLYSYAVIGITEVYLKMGKFKKALGMINYSLETFGESPFQLFLKAQALAGLEQWKAAYRNMKMAIESKSLRKFLFLKRAVLELNYQRW